MNEVVIDSLKNFLIDPLTILIFIIFTFFLILFFRGHSAEKAKNAQVNNSIIVQSIMDTDEIKFYHALISTFSAEYTVLTKVSLHKIIAIDKYTDNDVAPVAKIKSEYVDYLLCDKLSLRPIIAIEISNNGPRDFDRINREYLIKSVFEITNFPFLRHTIKREYKKYDLMKSIYDKIDKPL